MKCLLPLLFFPLALSAQRVPTFFDEFYRIPDSCRHEKVRQYDTYWGFLRFEWIGSPAEKMKLRVKYDRAQDRYIIVQKGSDTLRFYSKVSRTPGYWTVVHVIYCLGDCRIGNRTSPNEGQIAYFTIRRAAVGIKKEAKRYAHDGTQFIHGFSAAFWAGRYSQNIEY